MAAIPPYDPVSEDISEGMTPSRATQNREFGQDDEGQEFGGGAGEIEYGVFVHDPPSDPDSFRGDLFPDEEIVEVEALKAADEENRHESSLVARTRQLPRHPDTAANSESGRVKPL